MPDPPAPWGTCIYCGDAVPPGGAKCPTCGNPGSIGVGGAGALAPKDRRHLRFVQGLRLFIIVGVVVLLSYLMVTAAFTPPQGVSDPLTTSSSRVIAPGNWTALTGDVTGDDYVVGNYSVSSPLGAPVTFYVFTDSEFSVFESGRNATPLDEVIESSAAPIVFSAPYTDTFHFVWVNTYAPSTGLTVTLYEVTNYESNALVE